MTVTKRCVMYGPMCGAPPLGAETVPEVAPISKCTIPLAAVSVHDGGGLETFILMVLPLGEFSVPETQVLVQPAAQGKQAAKRSKADDVRER